MTNEGSDHGGVVVMDADAIRRAITRIAHEILERNKGADNLAVVGIRSRGVYIADRIANIIKSIEGADVPRGIVDIARFRDDVPGTQPRRAADSPALSFSVTGSAIVLCDDVLFTGRTTRAGMEAIVRQGRPALIALAVLIDRGHRELPIRPDFVGKHLPTSRSESVEVRLQEADGIDEVRIAKVRTLASP